MFLHLSVILFTGGVAIPPWADTPHPLGRPPPGQTPPPAQCMLGYGQQTGGTHPTGMQSCFLMCCHCNDLKRVKHQLIFIYKPCCFNRYFKPSFGFLSLIAHAWWTIQGNTVWKNLVTSSFVISLAKNMPKPLKTPPKKRNECFVTTQYFT